jgi:hypothetical protein
MRRSVVEASDHRLVLVGAIDQVTLPLGLPAAETRIWKSNTAVLVVGIDRA